MATFTRLYLLNQAPIFNPAATKGTWDDTAGAVVKGLDSVKINGQGATATVARNETSATNPFRVLLFQGISGPVAAQTISGTIDVVISIFESNFAADLNWGLHVWVTQGDTNTVRGTLLTDYSEALGVNEWPALGPGVAKGLTAAQTMTSVVASAGDRIVVELGYYARNTNTSVWAGTLRYGTCDAINAAFASDLTVGDGSPAITTKAPYILFGTAITEGTLDARLSQEPFEVFLDTNPDVRLSQIPREVFIGIDADAQLSQLPREVFLVPAADAQLSQLPREVFLVPSGAATEAQLAQIPREVFIITPDTSEGFIAQVPLEIAEGGPVGAAVLGQLPLEIAQGGLGEFRSAQLVVEVLRTMHCELPPPPPLPPVPLCPPVESAPPVDAGCIMPTEDPAPEDPGCVDPIGEF